MPRGSKNHLGHPDHFLRGNNLDPDTHRDCHLRIVELRAKPWFCPLPIAPLIGLGLAVVAGDAVQTFNKPISPPEASSTAPLDRSNVRGYWRDFAAGIGCPDRTRHACGASLP
jgi:hypothetical protein